MEKQRAWWWVLAHETSFWGWRRFILDPRNTGILFDIWRNTNTFPVFILTSELLMPPRFLPLEALGSNICLNGAALRLGPCHLSSLLLDV